MERSKTPKSLCILCLIQHREIKYLKINASHLKAKHGDLGVVSVSDYRIVYREIVQLYSPFIFETLIPEILEQKRLSKNASEAQLMKLLMEGAIDSPQVKRKQDKKSFAKKVGDVVFPLVGGVVSNFIYEAIKNGTLLNLVIELEKIFQVWVEAARSYVDTVSKVTPCRDFRYYYNHIHWDELTPSDADIFLNEYKNASLDKKISELT